MVSSLSKLNPLKFLQPLGSCANYCQLALNAQLSLKLRLNWLRLRTWNLFLGRATRLLAWDRPETMRVMGLAVKEKKKKKEKSSAFLVLLSFTLGLTWHSRWTISWVIWMCLYCLPGKSSGHLNTWKLSGQSIRPSYANRMIRFVTAGFVRERTTLALCYWPVVGTARCYSVWGNPRQSQAGVQWNNVGENVSEPLHLF